MPRDIRRPAATLRPSRRDVLRTGLALGAGVLISQDLALGAQPGRPGKRVVVVGAGLAGLACAFELSRARYDVVVLEARDRVGGRVLSFTDFIDGATIEGGGEFIGLNHPRWRHYARVFDLDLLEVSDVHAPRPLVLAGKRLPFDESTKIYDEVDALLLRLCAPAESVDADEPWKSPDAAKLDEKTLGQWLVEQNDVSPAARAVAILQMSSDNAVHVDRQSLLANLAMVKGGGLEKFWSDTEWFRCKKGNQELARELARELGDRVRLKTPVTSIEKRSDGGWLVQAGEVLFEADDVVLAVPPSVYASLRIEPALPEPLKLQTGLALKYLSSVTSRFWLQDQCAPDGMGDGLISQTWDATDGQDRARDAALCAFIAGPQAEASLAIERPQRDAAHGEAITMLLPGFATSFSKSRYMDWPRDPAAAAGYCFPAPGEIMRAGRILRDGVDTLHFAGEHCSYAFIGYMEGALESGARIARSLATRDGVL